MKIEIEQRQNRSRDRDRDSLERERDRQTDRQTLTERCGFRLLLFSWQHLHIVLLSKVDKTVLKNNQEVELISPSWGSLVDVNK